METREPNRSLKIDVPSAGCGEFAALQRFEAKTSEKA
jgi:hypothetical protein